jgi:hypothetical protein
MKPLCSFYEVSSEQKPVFIDRHASYAKNSVIRKGGVETPGFSPSSSCPGFLSFQKNA